MNDGGETIGRAARMALGHIRASGGLAYDQAAFAMALRSGTVDGPTARAVEDHLREADPAELVDLVAEGSATFASLERLARRMLEADHPNALFLIEACR